MFADLLFWLEGTAWNSSHHPTEAVICAAAEYEKCLSKLVNSAETRGNASVQYFDEEEIDQVMVFRQVMERVIAQHEKNHSKLLL